MAANGTQRLKRARPVNLAGSRARTPQKSVRVIIIRHGKYDSHHPNKILTEEGKAASKNAAGLIPPGYKLKIYHSEMDRARETSEHFAAGAKKRGLFVYPKARKRTKLGYNRWALNEKAYENLFKKMGALDFTRAWIDNDPSVLKVSRPAAQVADETIRETRLAKRLHEQGTNGIVLGKFSHAIFPEVVLWRLTGLRFDSQTNPRNTPCRYNEALQLIFENGRVILEYRNIRKDVTRKYNEIVRPRRIS